MSHENKYGSHTSIMAIKCSYPKPNAFSFCYVTITELYKMLMKMDVKKSTGFDNIPAKFLEIGTAPLADISSNLVK